MLRPAPRRDQRPEIQALDALLVGHPHLLECHRALLDLIDLPAGRNIVWLYGPPGVGKTTLVTRIHDEMWRTHGPTDRCPGAFPALLIPAPPATAHGPASLKWATQMALREMGEPGVGRKRVLEPAPGSEPPDPRLYDTRAPLPPDFHALVAALRARGTRVVFVDEGHHFSEGISLGRVMLQMEYFKLLADLSGALVVIVGTYAVLDQRNINSQLGRRSDDVHFRRYRADEPGEWQLFLGFLNSLERDMEAQDPARRITAPCLVEQATLLYARSVGCVGIVKDWVLAAAGHAVRSGRTEIRAGDLRAKAPTVAKAKKLYAETEEAETRLAAEEEGEDALMLALGLCTIPAPVVVPAPKAPKNRRPGDRHPHGDPVGELAANPA